MSVQRVLKKVFIRLELVKVKMIIFSDTIWLMAQKLFTTQLQWPKDFGQYEKSAVS